MFICCRKSFKMAPGQKGVLARTVQPSFRSDPCIQSDDVIMRFDNVQVANDGTVPFRCPTNFCSL